MISAIIVSITLFSHESIRLDETQSVWQVSHNIPRMLEIVAQDVHVPLYHFILHYWTYFFGTSPAAVRAPSLIFFIISIPFVFLLTRFILSRRWALVVTALYTFSPFMNWYANEARMYTLLALMVVISQYFFIRIMQGKKNSWPWYLVAALLGAYSHYFFLFSLATQGIFFLLNFKKFPKKTFIKFVGTAAAVLAFLSPWLYYFISQGAAADEKPLLSRPSSVDFFNAYSQFLFGFQSISLNTILVSCWPLVVVLAFFIVRRHVKLSFPMSYILFAAFIPVLVAYGLSFVVNPLFISRYLIASLTPLLILTTWFISLHSKKGAIVGVTITLLATAVLFTTQMTSAFTPVRENYQSVVSDVTKKATPNDVIAISTPFTVYPFEYYYKGTSQIVTLPNWDRQNPGPVPAYNAKTLPEQVTKLIKGHTYVYLVLSYNQGYEKNIQTYFRDHFELVSHKTYSTDLSLYVYKVGYADPVYYTH